MQLKLLLLATSIVANSAPASADGEITVTGAYYKERSTRVIQPMVDARLDIGEEGELRTHVLVDSITSASAASGAAGVAFTETRSEFGGSYLHNAGRLRVGGGFRYSDEPDYRSLFGIVRGRGEFAQKNATVTVTLARGHDRVTNAGAQIPMADLVKGTMDTSLASVSISQILTQQLVASLTYDAVHLEGFLQNPYRVVIAGGAVEAERHPGDRTRHAVAASLRGVLPTIKTALSVGYRLYADDWGIVGHTPEIRIAQEIGSFVGQLRYRLHRQSAADFYRDVYDSADPTMEPFLTSDQKLDEMTTFTVGAKGEFPLELIGFAGRLARVRASVLVEYVSQTTTFGNGIASQLALTVPLNY